MPKSKPKSDEVVHEDLTRWHIHEYAKMSEFEKFPKWIGERVLKTVDIRKGFLADITKLRRLKKLTVVDSVNYICSVFKVQSLKNLKSVNYAFMYSTDNKYHTMLTKLKSTEPTPLILLYTVSPALLSQDGEYRNRLLTISQLDLLEHKYSKTYEYIERFLLAKIEKYELTLDYEHFYPLLELEKLDEALDNKIVSQGLIMRFFIQYWLTEVYNLSVGLQENHVNPKFNELFFPDIKEDLEFFKNVCKKFGQDKMAQTILHMTLPIWEIVIPVPGIRFDYIFIGQKLRPLNVGEVQNPLNIKFSPWREAYLSLKSSDLICNGVCSSFSIFLDWFYIKNSKKGLFDNEQQYQKLEFSERSLVITRKLREAQRITYTPLEALNKPKDFLNPLFESLYYKIDDPIDFAKANLLMSNVTLAFLTENVGRTFYDIPELNKSKPWTNVVGDILGDETVFKKYIWDICYAILCLNVKLGMTHSDLHLNNATINHNYNVENLYPVGSRELFNIMGYMFSVKSRGTRAYIIDFSRGTIHPNSVRDFEHFKSHEDYLDFVDDQNQRIVNKLDVMIPTFMKIHRTSVMELLEKNFDKFYKLYSAVDTLDFSKKLSSFLDKKTSKSNIDLLKQIEKISEYYLTTIMLKLIQNHELEFDWPVFYILKECFQEYIVDPNIEQPHVIINLWDFDKPMLYSMEKYDKFPPILKKIYGLKDTDEKTKYIIEHFAYLDSMRHHYERYRRSQMKMINYIAERHLEKYK